MHFLYRPFLSLILLFPLSLSLSLSLYTYFFCTYSLLLFQFKVFCEYFCISGMFSSLFKYRSRFKQLHLLRVFVVSVVGVNMLLLNSPSLQAWVNFINVLTCSFYVRRSQKPKMLLEMTVFLHFWDLHM